MRKPRCRDSGGPPSHGNEHRIEPQRHDPMQPPVPAAKAERRPRVRSMMPAELDYDPFADSEHMKRFVADLAGLVLRGKIHHRAATACRLLVESWIAVDEHERLDEVEKRIGELERAKQR